jgi:hypothetical protein
MADTSKDKGMDEAFARMKQMQDQIAEEVEQHKGDEVDLGDLENVSGGAEAVAGWKITYET